MTGPSFYLYNDETPSAGLPEQAIPLTALRYGTGCFETMRYEPSILQDADVATQSSGIPFLMDHLHRMYEAIGYLTGHTNLQNIPSCPPKETWIENLNRILIQANLHHATCLVRFQVWIEDHHGFFYDPAPNIHRLIEIRKLFQIDMTNAGEETSSPGGNSNPSIQTAPHQQNNPVHLCYVSHQTISSESRPCHLKLSNMLHYRDAYRTARSFGAHDGILCSSKGFLAETAIANLFWVCKGVVYTPSRETNILPGITRNRLLDAFTRAGIPCKEGTYTPDALQQADEVWITNSLREITPVASVTCQSNTTHNKTFQHHEFTERVYQLYQQAKQAES